jgi:hypothetical protein
MYSRNLDVDRERQVFWYVTLQGEDPQYVTTSYPTLKLAKLFSNHAAILLFQYRADDMCQNSL